MDKMADEATPLLLQDESAPSPPADDSTSVKSANSRRRLLLLLLAAVLALALAAALVVGLAVGSRHLQTRPDTTWPPPPRRQHHENDQELYDVIIVGGGPAGSVLARKLSDDPWRKVLLIEAGDASQAKLGGTHRVAFAQNQRHLTPFDIPYYWTSVANMPEYHFDYVNLKLAKVLGGCGIHNGMLYVRALPQDIRRWQLDEWTWQRTLEIYMEMEEFVLFDAKNATHRELQRMYHGTNGIIRTSRPPVEARDPSMAFLRACEQVGIGMTEDFNAPNQRVGAGFYHFNIRNGLRDSAAKAFLGPILDATTSQSTRDNFHLQLNTLVTRVLINEKTMRAEGVEVMDSTAPCTANSSSKRSATRQFRIAPKGQVFLAAGAINTPKLLMLSGIGDGLDLQEIGVPLKNSLPRVGKNLQDHPVVGIIYDLLIKPKTDVQQELRLYFDLINARNVSTNGATAVNQSLQSAFGLDFGLMGSSGISTGAFLIPPGSTYPEIQLTFFPRISEPHLAKDAELNHPLQIVITVTLTSPAARNRVVLPSKDIHASPRIQAEVPEEDIDEHLTIYDKHKLVWGINAVRQIASAPAFRGIIGREVSPGSRVASPQELERWVFNSTFRNHHWVGSAAMARDRSNGAIDSHLRVFGIPNLRVGDASAIPVIPNGNVHSSVLMVALHAAELLKREEQEAKAAGGH